MSPVTPGTSVARASDSITEDLGPEAVVWLAGDRTLHLLDRSGATVWRALDRPSTAAVVAERVDRAVHGDPDVVLRDVLRFLSDLANRSLVVITGSPRGEH